MGATFVITLREAFEASLLLGIVYAYLEKIGARSQFGYVTWGAVLGLLGSIGLGVAVGMFSGPLVELGPDLIALGVMLLAVIVLTWHGWWMRQHARAIKGDVQRRIDEAHATQRFWIVGLIAFSGVFREGAETVLFLWGLMAQARIVGGWGSTVGGVLGVALAAMLGWAIFHGGRRVSLRRFFAVTTCLILLLAAGLLSTAVGRLQGLGWLPMTDALWDTSAILSDQGLVGSFLAGLVGYRAQPTGLEVTAYVLYVVVAGALIFGSGRTTDPEAADRSAVRA
jgi:high-affinity iron transporter